MIKGLPLLQNLELESVYIQESQEEDDDVPTKLNRIQKLVKHCKLLESLGITSIDFINLMIEDAPSMKDLTIKEKLSHLAI